MASKKNLIEQLQAKKDSLGSVNLSAPWGEEEIVTGAIVTQATRDSHGLRLCFQKITNGEPKGMWSSDYFRGTREGVALAEIAADPDKLPKAVLEILVGEEGSYRFEPQDAPVVTVRYRAGTERTDGKPGRYGCSVQIRRSEG